jgi:hypothetical protein
MKYFTGFVRTTLLGLLFLFAMPALAQEKTGNKPGFTLQPGTVRIVLMRPSIRVGEQSTGGLFEPNADWTAQARENIGKALKEAQKTLGNEIIEYEEGISGEGPLVTQYEKLFGALAGSVIEYQFFRGNRLPTKVGKDAGFNWSMGQGLTKLQSLDKGDYALFILTEDQFGSTGRKLLQFAAALAYVSVKSGVHKGYAGLIDLKTGELVWLNADAQMGGDVRIAEGAEKRVKQLLEGFPGRSASGGSAAK